MTEPQREWEVFVREHDGRGSKSTFAEPVSPDPPFRGHVIIVEGRD